MDSANIAAKELGAAFLAISPSCFSSQNLISYARVSALIIYAI
jgi:hypothetical protein